MYDGKIIRDNYFQISAWYDAMYVDDEIYKKEASQVDELINKYKHSAGNNLLDLGCGTGPHIKYWADKYNVVGLDNNIQMLKHACESWPQKMFVCGDMFNFSHLANFDIATCLYGSIGYAENIEMMEHGIACVSKCLNSGGIYILAAGELKESFEERVIIKTKKISTNNIGFRKIEMIKRVDENKGIICMNHKISTNEHTQTYKFDMPISLFSKSDYRKALTKNGFSIKEEKTTTEFRMGAFVCVKE